jgi:hypothetical protein
MHLFPLVLQPQKADPCQAKAWVLGNGAIASVDKEFTDWFGWRPGDLLGSNLSSVLVEVKELAE